MRRGRRGYTSSPQCKVTTVADPAREASLVALGWGRREHPNYMLALFLKLSAFGNVDSGLP
jgi:hypothetical protein